MRHKPYLSVGYSRLAIRHWGTESFQVYFNPRIRMFRRNAVRVAHDEAVAKRGELAGDVFRVANMWFRNSLYAARFSVSGVKISYVERRRRDDQSVGKSGGKRC